jgi:enhancing lycopene biosynthesis protein 2
MPKRVAVILSGCGAEDGSEIREALLTLLSLERAGAEAIFAAPDVPQGQVANHMTGAIEASQTRRALEEAARIGRGKVRDLATLKVEDADALIVPGGAGVATTLSTYAAKAELCEVNQDVVRLLKGMLASHRPMGFICLAPLLAARVLGPVAGVRVTLGVRGSSQAKHAAIMGADVRPCAVGDVVIDQKARVISTPSYMYDDARLPQVASAIDKLVRSVLSLAKDRSTRPDAVQGARENASSATSGPRPPGASSNERRDPATTPAVGRPGAHDGGSAGPSYGRPRRRIITPGPGSA